MENGKILIVDDEEDIRNIFSDRLNMHGYETITAFDGLDALEKVEEFLPDLVLLDIRLPNLDGMEVLKQIKDSHPEIIVIMITAHGNIQLAVEAMKQGAYDFLEKTSRLDAVELTIDKALHQRLLAMENKYLRSNLKGTYNELIGRSQKMMDVLKTIEKVAPSDSTILITGESGTGKELVARALHNNSQRAVEPFVVVNCSAIQPTLLESEIFGHEKGAFTGAIARKPGKMELADKGTLFLDEIGDMAYELQAKFLRAIQEREFERVGGIRPVKVDVRFIAATNRDLREGIQNGKFREDLFYRLNVINIDIPPLRERREDINILAHHFLNKFSTSMKRAQFKITDKALELLINYPWPGNVRELQNCIERTVLLTDSEIIRPEHLPENVRSYEQKATSPQDIVQLKVLKPGGNIKDMEKSLILKTLEEVGGNRARTAKMLGISLRGLQYKLKEYNVAAE